MNIAWFSPFSHRSAIGEYSSIIVKELAQTAHVTVFVSDLMGPSEAWIPDCDMRYLETTPLPLILHQLEQYDILIYNLGNFLDYHGSILDIAKLRTGITILHDLVMTPFFAEYYFRRKKDRASFIKEMQYAHGMEGKQLAQSIVDTTADREIWYTPTMLKMNMAKSATYRSSGVIVHSQFAKQALTPFLCAPVRQIDFPQPHIASRFAENVPANVPATDNKIRLLSHGNLIDNKMIVEVIETIGQSPALRARVVYHIIGKSFANYADKINTKIRQYNLEDVVYLMGYQPDYTLHNYVAAADIAIILRNPHFGESSWTLLEALCAGKLSIVWKHGYYDEIPVDVVAKVDRLSSLARSLERLCDDDNLRTRMAARAKGYAQNTFSTQKYIRRLFDFIQATRYHQPVLDLADSMSRLLLQLDAATYSRDLVTQVTDEINALIGERKS